MESGDSAESGLRTALQRMEGCDWGRFQNILARPSNHGGMAACCLVGSWLFWGEYRGRAVNRVVALVQWFLKAPCERPEGFGAIGHRHAADHVLDSQMQNLSTFNPQVVLRDWLIWLDTRFGAYLLAA